MDYQSQPLTMWFDRRIVYRKSPIQGTGTYALEDIMAGEALMYVHGGLVYTAGNYPASTAMDGRSMYNEADLTDTLRIATPVSYHYFINHSCEANIVDLSRHPSWTLYVTLRGIRADEELTADYHTLATLAMCNCGTPSCRWQSRIESQEQKTIA